MFVYPRPLRVMPDYVSEIDNMSFNDSLNVELKMTPGFRAGKLVVELVQACKVNEVHGQYCVFALTNVWISDNVVLSGRLS